MHRSERRSLPLRLGWSTNAVLNYSAERASWMRARAKAPPEEIAAWSRRFRANPLWRLLEFEDWLHKMWQRRGQI